MSAASPQTASTAAEATAIRFEASRLAADSRAPYPGMRAFEQDEADLFFGRENSVDLMIDRLARTRFLAVVGASGSGKSSLVKTGLIRALRRGDHPTTSHRWKIAEMRPEAEPLRNLARALLTAARPEPPEQVEIDVLDGILRLGPEALVEWVDAGNFPDDWNLLILVDQFEELFRYKDYAQREERDAFVRLLLESSVEPSGRINVVLTMRSEYLDACSLLPELSRKIGEGLFLTSQMTLEEVREAIERPALRVNGKIQPELVNRLLEDLGQYAPWDRAETSDEAEQLARQADQLPLMQHVLNRMWRLKHGAESVLTLDDYKAIGGIEGALTKHAAEVVEDLKATFGEDTQRVVGRVFRALATGPSLSLAVRRVRSLNQLAAETGLPITTVRDVVRAFAAPECGFLRISKPEAGDDARVDLAHESLIRKWRSLSVWFAQEVTEGVNWTRLVNAAAPHSDIVALPLSAPELSAYNAWWKERNPTPKWADRYGGEFDKAARFLKHANHVQQVARIGVVAFIALIVAGAGGTGFTAYRQYEKQKDAKTTAALQERQFEAVRNTSTMVSTQICEVLHRSVDLRVIQPCINRYVATFLSGATAGAHNEGQGKGCLASQMVRLPGGQTTCATN
ncbi:MAG: hypothetical protein GC203_01720 [Phenylobacterium sp.]|uniref:nSTAND1 domain-containing NTPase n=1 Tax=Phenylobacterium sp. TaxID=1871053 RepID=UPI00260043D1|nr:hypothetical protein [Phenylobacterium sp.]MBI1196563.1 hypothetical protein [Phenylobacterium sp.]